MGHLESGRRDFRLSTIVRIAKALEVPMSELFLQSGSGTAAQRHPQRRKLGSDVERKRILEAVTMLEDAAQRLKELAGPEPPKPRSKGSGKKAEADFPG